MIPMENIRKLSDSYRNIQEAEVDVNKMIKDLGGDFSGSNEDQMRGVQLLKGLALSDDPKANEFMQKLDAATTQISNDLSEGNYGKKKKVKEEVEAVELLEKAQKIFMFTTKKEAEQKAKEVKGKVLELKKAMDGNLFAVVVIGKGLTKEEIETVEESKSLIDLLNNIKNGGKIEDTDLTEEDVNGILDFYENTLDETGQKEFNKMSITKIQSTMKKLGL